MVYWHGDHYCLACENALLDEMYDEAQASRELLEASHACPECAHCMICGNELPYWTAQKHCATCWDETDANDLAAVEAFTLADATEPHATLISWNERWDRSRTSVFALPVESVAATTMLVDILEAEGSEPSVIYLSRNETVALIERLTATLTEMRF
jgi:hypothetical protein